MKVLIVDDEALVRRSLRRALEKSGHVVMEAEDGRQALELWSQLAPDLVFLDVLMPRLSGPETLKHLKMEDRRRAKVILMSAFTGEHNSEKARSLGADLFVPKPFEDIFAIVKCGENLVQAEQNLRSI